MGKSSTETSGLVLPLKLLSLTSKGSKESLQIRQEVMKLLHRNLENVKCVPDEELTDIRKYVEKVKKFDQETADEITAVVKKFNPNL